MIPESDTDSEITARMQNRTCCKHGWSKELRQPGNAWPRGSQRQSQALQEGDAETAFFSTICGSAARVAICNPATTSRDRRLSV